MLENHEIYELLAGGLAAIILYYIQKWLWRKFLRLRNGMDNGKGR